MLKRLEEFLAMNQNNQITLYQTDDGKVELEVRMEQDSVWLSQDQMRELFGRERSVITKHLRDTFDEGELDKNAVCANFAHTAEDGKIYQMCSLWQKSFQV
jgi:hypothetical protein